MSSWLDLINTPHSEQMEQVNGRLEIKDNDGRGTEKFLTLLDSQAILAVSGDDAEKFLQGQCTADLKALAVGDSTYGAICTNKGRVISNFLALKTPDSILLRMSADVAQDTLEKIKKYAAFFKVEMVVWEAPSVAVLFNSNDSNSPSSKILPEGIYATSTTDTQEFYAEPGSSEALLALLKPDTELCSESAWYASQIKAGLVSVNICTTEQYLPHQLNLDRSGAISFTKGCYTGQEIVARTEYRGKSKRRIRPVKLATRTKDIHKLKIQTTDENPRDIELLMAAKVSEEEILASLLLPIDQAINGTFSTNGETANYEILDLPYQLED